MSERSQMTTQEKRIQRINQLKARLQKEEAKLSASRRKERTGQLVSWGVMVEEIFKEADAAGRQHLIESAKQHLKDRNLERALSGFARLSGEISDSETSKQASIKKSVQEKSSSFIKPDLPDDEL